MFFGPIRKTRWPPWPLIGWDIFDFSSETTEWNSTKLDRKQDLNVLYQVCVFRADQKNKMAALASDWLRHFRLLLWNRWTEFNQIWQEARSQRPLPSLCFSGQSEKQDGRPGLCWEISDFSSETAERNSTKLDRKQDLNVFYQVCVFGADRKNKMAALASDWLRHFRLLLWNRWMELNETWQEARSKRPLPSLCFSGWSEKPDGHPGLWSAETFFDFSSETAERNSTKLDRKQDLNVLYQVCVFRADRKNKMAALANPPKSWHIVLRCTICGPLGLLLHFTVKLFHWWIKVGQDRLLESFYIVFVISLSFLMATAATIQTQRKIEKVTGVNYVCDGRARKSRQALAK